MRERIYNFSAGPAILPLEVLNTVCADIMNYHGSGIGVMEMSHRSKDFEDILNQTVINFRELLEIDESFAVLFTTGGATNQFSMVPMNLLLPGTMADYIVTGSWAEKACEEAKKFGDVSVAASSKEKNHTFIPTSLTLSMNASYVHFTSNNTIYGTQFAVEPSVGNVPLVCDASSDLLHKKIDVNKYSLIYAGAQKNLGPAGITVVIIRNELLKRTPKGLPVMMDYNTYAQNNSLYNTIPTFPVYVVGEVLKWIKAQGGLREIESRNRAKAKIIYDYLDASEFYCGVAEKKDRSLMNVTFRLADDSLEKEFIKQADEQGFSGLKGHKSVGGMRASIYNAFPTEGCSALVEFMKHFEKAKG